ncbi:recombinase family protein [Natronosalvus amylolyticus]|uniref:recombinase family protein n=1 Tax=Natronosalvus amylolyticus TaxID=2961994 RepID=UPI0020C945DF|nr:recombinase family protein [Natronosalvus amylolyticus]
MSKTAIGYTRLSQTSDTSIPDQKREIRDLADEQGFKLLEIFDDGQKSSGFDNERDQYLEMQAVLEDEEIDVLIVRDRDRLSRDKRERSMLYYDLDEWDVELWTTTDGQRVDFGDDESWLIEMIRNYMDDVAKRRDIQKAKRKIKQRVENGYYQGRPPTGTQFDENGQYLVPDKNFDAVLRVLSMRARGYSYSETEEETGIAQGTIANIMDRQDEYIELGLAYGYDVDGLLNEDDESEETVVA